WHAYLMTVINASYRSKTSGRSSPVSSDDGVTYCPQVVHSFFTADTSTLCGRRLEPTIEEGRLPERPFNQGIHPQWLHANGPLSAPGRWFAIDTNPCSEWVEPLNKKARPLLTGLE